MPTPTPAFLNARQLAEHLNVTIGFVRRKTCEKKIPSRKLGHRTVRYDLAEVLAALGHGAPEPPPAAQHRRPVPRVEPTVLCDLPTYNWSPSPPPDGTVPEQTVAAEE